MLMNESIEQATDFTIQRIQSANTTVLPDVYPKKTAYNQIGLRRAQEPSQNETRGSGGFIR